MGDLIRRSDVIARINGTGYAEQIKDTMRFAVGICPAVDAVEVVRCRECIHYGNKQTGCAHFVGLITPESWYCPRGQRREDGDT